MRNPWTCALLVVVSLAWVRGARGEEPPAPAPAAATGYVGLELAPAYMLAPEDRQRFGHEPSAGIVVTMVLKDGPAHRAGVRYGERVLKLAGNELPAPKAPDNVEDYIERTGAYRAWLASVPALGIAFGPGDEVEVVVQRDRKPTPVKVRALSAQEHLALLEAMAKWRFPDPPAPPEGSPPAPPARGSAGLQVSSAGLMDERERRFLKVETTNALVVVHLMPGSPAALGGVKAGDLLTRFAGKPAFDTTGMDLARWQEAFQAFIGVRPAGEEVEVELLRGATPVKARLRLVDTVTLNRAGLVAGSGNRF